MRPRIATLAKITTLAKSKSGETAKAETIVVLDHDIDQLKLLVLYDNIDEGAPMQHEIAPRQRLRLIPFQFHQFACNQKRVAKVTQIGERTVTMRPY